MNVITYKIKYLIILLAFMVWGNVIAYAITIGDFNFYFTNEFVYRNNELANKKNQYYELLTISSNYKKFSLSLSLRENNFYKQSPNVSFEDMSFDVYKKLISYNAKNLSLNVGDFNSLLGRGLVLSVLKNADIKDERSILGGNLRYAKSSISINLLGGRVNNNLKDQEWTVFGGEFIYKYLKGNYIGTHLSVIDDINTWKSLGKRYTYSLSLNGDNIFNKFSYSVEIASLDFENKLKEKGYGFFSKIAYNSGNISVFTEYKKYKNFDNELNSPPVADKSDEIVVLKDSEGVRTFLEYSFVEPDISVFFNLGWYREYDNSGLHYYGGVNIADLWDRLSFNISYGIKEIMYPIKKLEADTTVQLNDTISLELSIKDKRYVDGEFKFNEQDINVQLNFLPKLSINFLYQYSHNKIIDLNNFYSGGVSYIISDSLSLKITGGSIRGGTVCSGGQCFMIPPFKGVKLSVLFTMI